MKKMTARQYEDFTRHADVLEREDGVDVLFELHDGRCMKLFPLPAVPLLGRGGAASAFCRTVRKLEKKGVPVIRIDARFSIPSIRKAAVVYCPLEGKNAAAFQHHLEQEAGSRLEAWGGI